MQGEDGPVRAAPPSPASLRAATSPASAGEVKVGGSALRGLLDVADQAGGFGASDFGYIVLIFQ